MNDAMELERRLFRKGKSVKTGCEYTFKLLSDKFSQYYDDNDRFRSYCDDCEEVHLFTEVSI